MTDKNLYWKENIEYNKNNYNLMLQKVNSFINSKKYFDISSILSEIYNLCAVRENPYTYRRTPELSERYKFIIKILKKLNIPYEVYSWNYTDDPNEKYHTYFHSIFLRGTSNKAVVCHYDVLNLNSDNANDNSASVINAIALKMINPEVNVFILDSEEPPHCCEGSRYLSLLMESEGHLFENIDWFLNLELTGFGKNFLMSNYDSEFSELFKIIKEKYNPYIPKYLPVNDAYQLYRRGYDAQVVTTFDYVDGKPDLSHLHLCHSVRDCVENIKLDDMKNFIENFLVPITKTEKV